MDTIQTIDKLKEVFAPIAEKIGQGAEFGWQIVVKQQIGYGIMGLFLAIGGIVFIIIGFKVYKDKIKINEHDKDTVVYFLIIPGLATFILGTIFGILHLFNPEYYAIQFFLGLVK